MEKGHLRNIYTADFETTTNPDDLRVWVWGLYSLERSEFFHGRTLDTFFNHLKYQVDTGAVIYFHNLKFDGEFLFYYLFENGFVHTDEAKLKHKQFSTLISNMGVFYSIKVCFDGRIYTFQDSLKLIPFKVSQIPRAFGLEIKKGDIDYHKVRPVGYRPTEEELDYLLHDVKIVAQALEYFYDQMLSKMTIASNALTDYKSLIGKETFERRFPVLPFDDLLRKSYKGGVVQVKAGWEGKDVGAGITLDVNSLYPYVMSDRKLPYGDPIYMEGKVEHDQFYDVSIQRLICNFELKEGYLPTLQVKGSFHFSSTEYLTSSDGVDVPLTLTSVDLDMFFEHYDVYNVQWIEGWKFRSSDTMFRDYVEKWVTVKNDATREDNKGMRTIAKLMLNSLYGKFGLNPLLQSKVPHYEEGLVKYHLGEQEERDPIYVPVASFITAYARKITLDAAQANYDRFLYCDTDSLHLLGEEIPDNIRVDQVELGAWKVEGVFTRARFLRAKSYIEEVDGELDIKCAGLPDQCKDGITYENFKFGLVVHNKLEAKRVKGGVYLKEKDFEIKA